MFGSMFSGGGLHMASYTFDGRGLFTVTLSDGSVWQQDPNDTNFAHFSGKASDYPVTVRTAISAKPGWMCAANPVPIWCNASARCASAALAMGGGGGGGGLDGRFSAPGCRS